VPFDFPDDDGDRAPAAPTLARVVAVAWIVGGGFFLAFASLDILLIAAAAANNGRVLVPLFRLGCGSAIGVFFLWAGVRAWRGTAGGLVGPGVASVALGLLYIGVGLLLGLPLAMRANGGQAVLLLLLGAACGLLGLALLAAGVMAFCAEGAYQTWRESVARQSRRDWDE
jgi:hypothetical protein